MIGELNHVLINKNRINDDFINYLVSRKKKKGFVITPIKNKSDLVAFNNRKESTKLLLILEKENVLNDSKEFIRKIITGHSSNQTLLLIIADGMKVDRDLWSHIFVNCRSRYGF